MKLIVYMVVLLIAPVAFAGHDYAKALTKSILFFEAQRSGYLPDNQRITWRANSGLQDGKSNGVYIHTYIYIYSLCFSLKLLS